MLEYCSNSATSLTLITLQTTRCERSCGMMNNSNGGGKKGKYD